MPLLNALELTPEQQKKWSESLQSAAQVLPRRQLSAEIVPMIVPKEHTLLVPDDMPLYYDGANYRYHLGDEISIEHLDMAFVLRSGWANPAQQIPAELVGGRRGQLALVTSHVAHVILFRMDLREWQAKHEAVEASLLRTGLFTQLVSVK
jgi:hypothetical protein